jgi:hypothetical protein
MSRHREAVDVFWAREDFRDQGGLDKALCRVSDKGMAHDLLEEAEAARVAPLRPRPQPAQVTAAEAAERARAERVARRRELVEQLREVSARATTQEAVLERLPEVREARAREQVAEKEAHAAVEALGKHLTGSWLDRLRGPSREALETAREAAIATLGDMRRATTQLLHDPDLLDRAGAIAAEHNAPMTKLVQELRALDRTDAAERDAGRERGAERPGRGNDHERGGW